MEDEDLMPFGVHKGKEMQDVPAYYLLWLDRSGCRDKKVQEYINDNMDILLSETKSDEDE